MAEKISSQKLIILRVVTAVIILCCSEGIRRVFASYKKPPVKHENLEKTFVVQGLNVQKGSHRIILEGYGVITSGETVKINPEISGIITYINPDLEVGLTVKKDTVLFRVDDKDFKLAVNREKARISTIKSQIGELEKDIIFTTENIKLQEKEVELAKKDLERQKDLAGKGVGSKINEENSERAYINTRSMLLNTRQRLEASRSKIETLKSQINEAESSLEINLNNLNKCIVKSPGKLRVTSKNIEVGQLATPATSMITLESDENLEIPVMISGPDVVQWLSISGESRNLFETFGKSEAEIIWIESEKSKLLGTGHLSRIENYNSSNRMVRGLVQVDKLNSIAAAGMFCKVHVKGRLLEGVYKIPRVSITKNNMLMTVVDHRLKLVEVTPVYSLGDYSIVSSDKLETDITVLNSKLANPIEGLKVKLEFEENERK